MKKMSFAAVPTIVALISFTLMAAAQERVLGRGDIPFSFAANGRTFQAGTYQVRQIGESLLRIEEVRTLRGVTLLSPQNVAASSTIKLVFRTYGSRRFLAAVIAPAYQVTLPKSEAEKELRMPLANATMIALQVKH